MKSLQQHITEKLLINKNFKNASNELVDDMVKYLELDLLNDYDYCHNRWMSKDKLISDTELYNLMKKFSELINEYDFQFYDPKNIQYRILRKQKKELTAAVAKRYKCVATIPVMHNKKYQLFGKGSLYIEYTSGADFLRIVVCGPYGGVKACEFLYDYLDNK